ncbi:hypothetical protein BGX31_004563 [Mortierella sp. GBA43]|nr:hypothetical protein BGX31_004563 [Mortierella sp. GBA43]
MPLLRFLSETVSRVMTKRGKLGPAPKEQSQILEPVFSQLDIKSLFAVRLVCKKWSSIARRNLSLRMDLNISNLYPMDIEDRIRREQLEQKLATFDTLHISYCETSDWQPVSLSDTPWSDAPEPAVTSRPTGDGSEHLFLNALKASITWHNQRSEKYNLRKLSLHDTACICKKLDLWLPVLPAMTNLDLTNLIGGDIVINQILSCLPNLTSLTIEYAKSGEVIWNEDSGAVVSGPGPSLPQGAKRLGPTYKLHTLILRHIRGSPGHLESLLMALGELHKVEIRFMRLKPSPGVTFSRQQFYRRLSQLCPFLESFHFSLFQGHLSPEDAMVVQSCFPTLQELSLAGKDMDGFGMDARIHVLDYYSNFLTRLEMLWYTAEHTEKFEERLHEFLCNAVHLRHLVAPRVNYWAEYLDLEPIPGANDAPKSIQYYRPRSNMVPNSHVWRIKSKTWACRQLETLHLGIRARYGDSFNQDPSCSRIMFGYISRHCPKLRDVWITRNLVNLKLMGGLCLMSRLTALERLKITSYSTTYDLEPVDVNWMGHPQEDQEAAVTQSKRLFSKRGSAVASDKKQWRSGVEQVFRLDEEWHGGIDDSLSTKKMQLRRPKQSTEATLSKAMDMVLPLKDASESAYRCWPNLRWLILSVDTTNLFKQSEDVKLIERLRPDIGYIAQQWA